MGERNMIYLKNDEIYLYSHWDSVKDLIEILRLALIRGKERWDDVEYLNRIIFCEMIKDDVLSLTGFGISTSIFDGQIVLRVDIKKKEVEYDDGSPICFENFIKKK